MAKAAYQPPRQGIAGMIIDSVLMLVLVFCALKAPAWIAEWRAAEEATATEEAAPAGESAEAPAPAVTWEDLGQNAAMQAVPQFDELQVEPDTIEKLLVWILALAAELEKAAVT